MAMASAKNALSGTIRLVGGTNRPLKIIRLDASERTSGVSQPSLDHVYFARTRCRLLMLAALVLKTLHFHTHCAPKFGILWSAFSNIHFGPHELGNTSWFPNCAIAML